MLYITCISSLLLLLCLQFFLCRYKYFDFSPILLKERNDGEIKKHFKPTGQLSFPALIFGKKPNWILYPKNKIKRYLVAVGPPLSKLLLVIFICSGIFSAAQLYIDTHTRLDLFEAVTWKIERTVHKIDDYVKWLKPAFPYDVIISLLFAFLSGMYIAVKSVKKFYSGYLRIAGTILLVFNIFTSITFFGVRLGKGEEGRAGRMEMHKAEIITENVLLLREIREKQQEAAINTILSQPQVNEFFQEYTNAKTRSDSLDKLLQLNPVVLSGHPELKKVIDYSQRMDANRGLPSVVDEAETEFAKKYNEKYKGRDFYSDAAKEEFNDYLKTHREWFEHNVSAASTAAAKEKFEQDFADLKEPKSPWYEQYKDPLKKGWKGFYKKTVKAAMQPFVDKINEYIPFLGEFFDILIHDPLEEKAFDKAYEAFAAYQRGERTDAIKKAELSEDNAKIIHASLEKQTVNLKVLSSRLNTAIASANEYRQQEIERNFAELTRTDPWNQFREKLLSDINEINCPYFLEKKETFKEELEQWSRYLERNKEQLYLDHVTNLEPFFFEYAKTRDDMMEALGRGIAWYRSEELTRFGLYGLTVADAVKYYASQNSFDATEITLLQVATAAGHACPGR